MKGENYCFLKVRLCILLLSFLASINANAQYPSSKSAGIAGDAVVFIAAKFRLPGLVAGNYDTRYATGFLVSDQKKIYLVTTKHAFQNMVPGQYGMICDSIFISSSTADRLSSIHYTTTTGLKQNAGGCMFSDDKVDLAILTLNSIIFDPLLKSLRKNGRKPILLSAFQTDKQIKPADTMYHAGYMVYQHPELGLAYSNALGWAKWGIYDKKETSTSFLADIGLPLAGTGSPVVVSERLVGIAINRNRDEKLPQDLQFSKQATVIKSSVLLVLLRKLQSMENK